MDFQAGDAVEVAAVSGHQDEAMVEGCRSDQEVRSGDNESSRPQVAADLSESTRHWPADANHSHYFEEVLEGGFMFSSLVAVVDPLVDLNRR